MTDTDTKTCPECAETIKAEAKVCRYCGHRFDQTGAIKALGAAPNPSSKPGGLSRFGIPIFIASTVAIGGLVIAFGQPESGDGQAEADAAKARAYITKDFLDPSSAEFRNVVVTGTCVTGEVNGKNALGGFIGFSEFYYNDLTGFGKVAPEKAATNTDDLEALNARGSWEGDKGECMTQALARSGQS